MSILSKVFYLQRTFPRIFFAHHEHCRADLHRHFISLFLFFLIHSRLDYNQSALTKQSWNSWSFTILTVELTGIIFPPLCSIRTFGRYLNGRIEFIFRMRTLIITTRFTLKLVFELERNVRMKEYAFSWIFNKQKKKESSALSVLSHISTWRWPLSI